MHKFYFFILLISLSILGFSQTVNNLIIVDQFGYRPEAQKIAVIKDPVTGLDASISFSPGNTYALVNASNDQQVFTNSIDSWKDGDEHDQSGDRVWHFDFSEVQDFGTYYVLDIQNNVRSFDFEIKPDVYADVLKQAFRTFYYQRVGFAKEAPFADPAWEDEASHIGPQQDFQARVFDRPNDASTERDVSGGWYDAGDYNKYTIWNSNYIYEMMLAYEENPVAWSDDFNIPESGNGIPDILDEVKWGMDHILRLQNEDGSMISVIDEPHSSPPSASSGQTLYGAVNTTATLGSAGAFAYGAKVFGSIGMTEYAEILEQAAIDAWTWANANPNVIWRNNDAAFGSAGIAAGQQETDDYGRFGYKMRAAEHLYEITSETVYKDYFESNYDQIHLIQWTFAFPFETREQEILLYYTKLPGASESVVNNIKNTYRSAMESGDNFNTFDDQTDPYLSHMANYVWGSNSTKANQGNMFYDMLVYDINSARNDDALVSAENYIHYIHGLNPINRVYLSNMYDFGGDLCVNQFFHGWYEDGHPLWDEVGVSTYGPAPGFLVGGPNPSYTRASCCPNNCGSASNNALCNGVDINAFNQQPAMKAYMDINDNWPLNSWQLTENSLGYQTAYLRILSKFVDQSGVITSTNDFVDKKASTLNVYPNPAKSQLVISGGIQKGDILIITNQLGNIILQSEVDSDNYIVNLSNFGSGIYFASVNDKNVKFIVE